MPAGKSHRVTDLDTLKALGHPLRLKLYRALYMAGTATASQLADEVGEAVSLVSYHLRKLAAHGIIEEAPEGRGDARERWWQPIAQGISTRDEDWRDSPEGEAVHTATSRLWARELGELYEQYLDTKHSWSADWRDAAFDSGSMMSLTADELRSLGQEIEELLAKWRARAKAAQEGDDVAGREKVSVHVQGVPYRTGSPQGGSS
ncbi:helix-turn-helix domain-containing protein [Nonomuraea sp. NPDC046802]|uniref:winged helix-turn-helix domain-containing protein n=1 Tax=Nonomuraea sp. NPDC046802 TaxID=3154919 RepID=UPI0033CC8A2E